MAPIITMVCFPFLASFWENYFKNELWFLEMIAGKYRAFLRDADPIFDKRGLVWNHLKVGGHIDLVKFLGFDI